MLRAGQVVFHHESVVHGSQPNRANHPRVGFSIHYCAPHVRETRFHGATHLLPRDEDRPGYRAPDPAPKQDFDSARLNHMYGPTVRLKRKSGSRSIIAEDCTWSVSFVSI